jgi:hypothetical protein
MWVRLVTSWLERVSPVRLIAFVIMELTGGKKICCSPDCRVSLISKRASFPVKHAAAKPSEANERIKKSWLRLENENKRCG